MQNTHLQIKLILIIFFIITSASQAGGPVHNSCMFVDIDSLYVDFDKYAGERICTSGELVSEIEFTAVLPRDPALTRNNNRFVIVELRFSDLLTAGFKSGDNISVEGTVYFREECFSKNNDKPELLCIPTQEAIHIEDAIIR